MKLGIALPQAGGDGSRERITRANATLTARPLPDADRALFVGSVAQWADDLGRLASLGIDHTFFSIDGPIAARLAALAELRQRVG